MSIFGTIKQKLASQIQESPIGEKISKAFSKFKNETTVGQLPGAISDVAKSTAAEYKKQIAPTKDAIITMLQAIPRAGATAVQQVRQADTRIAGKVLQKFGIENDLDKYETPDYQPKGAAKIVLGDRPVRTVNKMAKTTRADVEELVGLDIGKGGAGALVVGGLVADLFPPVGGEKNILKELADKKTADEILPLLKNLKSKFNDAELNILAKDLEDKGTVQDVVQTLNDFEKGKLDSDLNPKQLKEKAELELEMNKLDPDDTSLPPSERTTLFNNVKERFNKFTLGFRERFEDQMIYQKELERSNGVFVDKEKLTPWETKQLMSARTNTRLSKLDEHVKSVAQNMQKTADELKVDAQAFRTDMNDFLISRHTPERNAALGRDGISGMTDDAARIKMSEIEAKPYFPKLKQFADEITEINNEGFTLLKESGIITDDLYNALRARYKNHIPLNRVMDKDLENAFEKLGIGRSFDVKGPVIKRAKGSQREVEDILTNVTEGYQRAIIASEKNRFGEAVRDFAENNKHLGFDIVNDTPDIKYNDPNILGFREAGKQKWIKIEDPYLASALKGTNVRDLGVIESMVGKFGRILAQGFTRFNPNYWLSGHIRDIQEMVLSASSTKELGFKGAGGVLSKNPKSALTIAKKIRGIDDADTQLYKQFIADGGGGGGFSSATKDKIKFDTKATGKIKKKTQEFIEGIDNINEFFENQNRFSVYKEAMERGLSRERAALLAQESTINFSRHGTLGPAMNALYIFSNVAVQGSTKIIRAFKTNPRAAAAFVTGLGTVTYMANEWNDSIEPGWESRVPKWDRDANLIFVLGEKKNGDLKYFTMPIGWGLKPIKVAADRLYDISHGKDTDGKDAVLDISAAIFDAYNPMGGSDLASALAPTIADIPLDIARNKKFSGSRIKPDTYGREVPESERYFDNLTDSTTGKVFQKGTSFLAKHGVEISPADLNYAFEQLTAGPGKFANQVVSLGQNAVEGDIKAENVPISSRFYKEIDVERQQSNQNNTLEATKFLKEQERESLQLKREAKELDEQLQKMTPAEANAKARQVKAENPDLYEKLKDVAETRKLDLSGEENKIKQMGVENGVRAKYIHKRVMQLKTPEEKNAYIKKLKDKKLISDTVFKQLRELKDGS